MKRLINIIFSVVVLATINSLSVLGKDLPNSGSISGTYNLTKNITLTGSIKVASGATAEIINETGQDITISLSKAFTMFSNAGELTINGKNGRIIINGGANMTVKTENVAPEKLTYIFDGIKDLIAINNTGKLTLNNVTIQDVYGGSGDGAALFINTATDIETKLNNCIISECYAERGSAIMIGSQSKGNVVVENSEINCCFSGGGDAQKTGGAIRTYGSTQSSLYLKNVTFRYNRALRINGWKNDWERDGSGGAIFWNARGLNTTILSIDGCRFEKNASDDNGGAIKTQASIEFVENPTYFIENVAPVGAGLYIEGYIGTVKTGKRNLYFNLSDKLIVQGNRAPSYTYGTKEISGLGAGVHFFFGPDMDLDSGSTITVEMNGSTITENIAEGNEAKGGGIYFENSSKPGYYKFNIWLNSGSVNGNTSEQYGGGIYVHQGSIKYNEEKTGGDFTISENRSNEGAGIYIQTGNLEIAQGSIISNTATGNGAGIHINGGNMTLVDGTISSNTITADGSGAGIHINGGSMTLMNGAISSNTINGTGNGGGIYVKDGGFTMKDGEVTGNIGTYGAGVYIDGGDFEMQAGTISQNGKQNDQTIALDGGGVYLNNGNFELTGGSINGNSTTGKGGGVYLQGADCEYILSAGTIRLNNAAYGGGVYLANGSFVLVQEENGEATISDNSVASISSNNASTNGGGVYIAGGNFTMNGGELASNTALNGQGGGVYIAQADNTQTTSTEETYSFTMNGGAIMNNQALSEEEGINGEGGGAYLNNGSMLISKGSILSNSATYDGGGIYIIGGGGLTLSEGHITGNYSSRNGGGAYISGGGSFTMTHANGQVSQNGINSSSTVTKNGGGIFLDGGTMTVNAGSIQENEATENGGGVYIMNGNVTMVDGYIEENVCEQYGGGVYVYNAGTEDKTVALSGGTIRNNEAAYGGGLCVNGHIILNVEEIQISGNEAINGGGICLMNNAFMDFISGQIISNKAISSSSMAECTAFEMGMNQVSGIGGGVYLDSNTSLIFEESDNLGLYGNTATNAADELFANGNNTTINIPDVSKMTLGDNVPGAGNLKWIKDYVVSDTKYDEGPALSTDGSVTDNWRGRNIRYRQMLSQNIQDMPQLKGGISADDERAKSYICFALGYEVIFLTLEKYGLQMGESAIFTIEKLMSDADGQATEEVVDGSSFQVILTGTGEALTPAQTDIAVTAGWWRITETDWSWTYNVLDSNGNALENRKIQKDVTDEEMRTFTFKAAKKDNLPLNHETTVIKVLQR